MTPTQAQLGEEAEAARVLTTALPRGQRWRPSTTDPEAIEVAISIPHAERVDTTALGGVAAAGWEWFRAVPVATGRAPRSPGAPVTAPVAVLVVPAEGDPGGLLADGRCGSGPPIVSRGESCGVDLGWLDQRLWLSPMALPLWWDGALVPEGWDRARRVIDADPNLPGEAMEYVHDFHPSVGDALTLAGWLVGVFQADRVVLLDRIDGRLVERAP